MAPQNTVVVDERDIDSSSGVAQKNVKKRWVSYIWDTLDKSPEERRLLFKLDTAILTFASLGKCAILFFLGATDANRSGYFIKYLDQININNAFVSGMQVTSVTIPYGTAQLTLHRKEDLGMYGNQLNYIQACWTVGYVIGEIPSNMLLTRVRPRYWIPAMEVSIAF